MTDRLDDFITNAVHAARSRASAGADDGAATRLRLRESIAGGGHGRRKRRLTIIAAVIASLFGSAAFAAYLGGWRPLSPEPPPAPAQDVAVAPSPRPAKQRASNAGLPSVVETPAVVDPVVEPAIVEPAIEPAIVEPAIEPKPAPRVDVPVAKPRRVEATVTKPAKPRVEVPATKPPVDVPRVDTHVVPPVTTSAPRIDTSQPSSAPRVDNPAPSGAGELAAYRIAHEAHFRGTDPAAALAAWNAYLARFPDGQLAPEARYDRALVLIKLKRYPEAKQALAAFAYAPAGSYRQREAAKLLAALPKN